MLRRSIGELALSDEAEIRDATTKDASAIERLLDTLKSERLPWFSGQSQSLAEIKELTRLAERLPIACVLVATVGHKLSGYVTSIPLPIDPEAEVTVYVSSESRRTGLGRQLLCEVIRRARRSSELDRLRAKIVDGNDGAESVVLTTQDPAQLRIGQEVLRVLELPDCLVARLLVVRLLGKVEEHLGVLDRLPERPVERDLALHLALLPEQLLRPLAILPEVGTGGLALELLLALLEPRQVKDAPGTRRSDRADRAVALRARGNPAATACRSRS